MTEISAMRPSFSPVAQEPSMRVGSFFERLRAEDSREPQGIGIDERAGELNLDQLSAVTKA